MLKWIKSNPVISGLLFGGLTSGGIYLVKKITTAENLMVDVIGFDRDGTAPVVKLLMRSPGNSPLKVQGAFLDIKLGGASIGLINDQQTFIIPAGGSVEKSYKGIFTAGTLLNILGPLADLLMGKKLSKSLVIEGKVKGEGVVTDVHKEVFSLNELGK